MMRVRFLFTCLVLAVCIGTDSIGAAHATDPEAAVRATIARNIDGWSKYDADEIAGTYAPDAIWQNPFGVRLQGPKQLKSFLIRLFARPGFRAGKDTSAPSVQAVRMLGPDAAVVWSEESSTGQIENGKPLGDRHSHYLQVLHRTSAGWLITDDMIMDERALP
jgi:uncharacterized protein (TIGR02246 family)